MISHNTAFNGKILDMLVVGLVAFARIESVEPFTSWNIHPQSQSLKLYNRNHSFKKIQNDKVFTSKPEKRITKIVIRVVNDDNDISSSPKEDEEAKQWLSGKQGTNRNSAGISGESDRTWKIEPNSNVENESSYTPIDFSDIDAILDPDHDSFLMNAWNEFQMNSGVPNQGMASAGEIAEFLLRSELEQRYIQGEVSQADLEDDMQTIKDYMSRKQESEKPPPVSQLKYIAKEERSKRLDVESRLAEEISSKKSFKEDILSEMKRVEENASKIEKEREAEKAEFEKMKQEAKKAEEYRLAEAEKWKEELKKVEEDRRKESEQREEELRRKEEEMNALIAQKQKLKEKYIAEKLEEKRQENIRLEEWAKESSGSIQSPEEDTAYKLYLEWMSDELNEKPTNEIETETDQGRIKEIISSVKSSFGITKTDSEQIGNKIAETEVTHDDDFDKVADGSNEKMSPEESKDDLYTGPSVDQPAEDEPAINVTANEDPDKLRTEKLKELYIAQKMREKRFKERETTISQEESIVMRSVEKARLKEELRLKNETEILNAVKKEKIDVTEQERIDDDRREYVERRRREEEMIVLDEEESRRLARLKSKSKQPDINGKNRLESKVNFYQTDKLPLDQSEEKNRREKLKKKFLNSRQNPDLKQANNDEIEQQKFDKKMVIDSKQLVSNETSNSNEDVKLAEQARIEDDKRRKQEQLEELKQQQQQEEERLREEARRKADEKKLKEALLAEQARIEDDKRRKQEQLEQQEEQLKQQQQEEERLREEARRKADEKKLNEARLAEQARIEDDKRRKQEQLELQEEQLKQQQEEERLREEARRKADEKKLKEAHLLDIRLAKQKREKEEQIRKTNELMMRIQENVSAKKYLDQSHVSFSRTTPKTFKVMRRIIENPSDGSIHENANDGSGDNSLIMDSSKASRSRLFRVQARTSDILKRITASAKRRMTDEFEEEETENHSETSEMDDKKFTYRKPSRNSRLFIKPTPYRYGEFRKITTSKPSRGKNHDGLALEKTKTIVLSTLVLVLMRRLLQLSFGRFPI